MAAYPVLWSAAVCRRAAVKVATTWRVFRFSSTLREVCVSELFATTSGTVANRRCGAVLEPQCSNSTGLD